MNKDQQKAIVERFEYLTANLQHQESLVDFAKLKEWFLSEIESVKEVMLSEIETAVKEREAEIIRNVVEIIENNDRDTEIAVNNILNYARILTLIQSKK